MDRDWDEILEILWKMFIFFSYIVYLTWFVVIVWFLLSFLLLFFIKWHVGIFHIFLITVLESFGSYEFNTLVAIGGICKWIDETFDE